MKDRERASDRSSWPLPAGAVSWERIDQGVRIQHAGASIEVRIPVAGVASVVRCGGDPAGQRGLFARPAADAPRVTVAEHPTGVRVTGAGVTVSADLRTGALSFRNAAGQIVVAEAPAPPPLSGVEISRVQAFTVDPDAPLHGLGQF